MTAIDKDVALAVTPERLITATAVGDVNRPRFKVLHLQTKSDNTGTIQVGVCPTGLVASFTPVHHLVIPSATNVPSVTIESVDGSPVIPVEDIWVKASVDTDGVIGYYLER